MFSPGDKLENGHYTIIKELGQGGMGVVYHCHDELLQRDVAIKMLLPELMSNQDTVETFHQEARLAAQLEHPNIVTIYDIGQEKYRDKVQHYMAMEYLPGGNLAGRIAQQELSIEHKLNWMKQLAGGLSFAHKRGVVHRDIKAENIFLTEEGDLKIGDFGLARLAAGRVRTRTLAGMGTPAYMSPELCRGDPQDHRSDIYSMGVLFFEVATGELPYRAKGMIEMAMKHSGAPIPSSRKLNALVPEILDKLIQKMMAKTPEERYQSMSEVVTVIDELIFEQRLERLGLSRTARVNAKGLHTRADSGFFPKSANQPTNTVSEAPSHSQAPVEAKSSVTTESTNVSTTSSVSPPPTIKPDGIKTQPLKQPTSNIQTATEKISPTKSTQAPLKPLFKPALELVWTFNTCGPIGWKSMPVVHKDGTMVFVGSADGQLYAIETSLGHKLWSFATKGPILTSAVLLSDQVIVASTDGAVYALLAKNGLLQWKHQGSALCITTPAIHQDSVVLSTMDGRLGALTLQEGFLKWQYEAGSPVVSMSQHYGDLVYCGTKSGELHAVSVNSGHRQWKTTLSGSCIAGPVASADAVYIGSQSGTFYALEASSGKLIWQYETSKPIVSGGVIAFTSVVFCSQDKWLYCCDKYDGHLMWKAPVRGRVAANLISSGGSIYAVTIEGWVQSFSHKQGSLRWQLQSGKRLESSPLVTPKMLILGTVEGEVLAYLLSND
ncbi:MAG: PQQ-binding-like beta-propeller repeat protein [Candidatus Melainabacteria bacterium]|nr:PQQ-binding-like beta-propeller repeat protein [Candidatus Melainabacteria bacterium]